MSRTERRPMDGRLPESLIADIATAVEGRLGGADSRHIAEIVREELLAAMRPPTGTPDTSYENASRVVVTSSGRNRPGVLARLAAAVDEFNGDIRDLSQTIVGDYFTMLFVVDVPEGAAGEESRFLRLRQRLKEVAADLGAHVVVMHDDMLSVMHEI